MSGVEAVEGIPEEGFEQNFASVAVLSGTGKNSNNPMVQAHKTLSVIEESNRKVIKEEEKRQSELRKAWKEETIRKADNYNNSAGNQKWWRNASGLSTASIAGLPFAGIKIGEALINSSLTNRFVNHLTPKDIEGFIRNGADTARQVAPQFFQDGSQVSQKYSQEKETILDQVANQERQDLEQQGQTVQEAKQNETSLKERHLEIIKTLTQQVMNH